MEHVCFHGAVICKIPHKDFTFKLLQKLQKLYIIQARPHYKTDDFFLHQIKTCNKLW